jgi:hypothetical protein
LEGFVKTEEVIQMKRKESEMSKDPVITWSVAMRGALPLHTVRAPSRNWRVAKPANVQLMGVQKEIMF